MSDRKDRKACGEISKNPCDTTEESEEGVILNFQKLDVYQCSIELVSMAFEAGNSLPRGHAKLVNQLDRASWSVPLNIAEGYGKITKRDKSNFYSIARGSVMECAAIFDVLKQRRLISDEQHRHAMSLADRIVAMLSKMCR